MKPEISEVDVFWSDQIRIAVEEIARLNSRISLSNRGKSSKRQKEKKLDRQWRITREDLSERYDQLIFECGEAGIGSSQISSLKSVFEKIYVFKYHDLNREAAEIGKTKLPIPFIPKFGGFQIEYLARKLTDVERSGKPGILDELCMAIGWSLKHWKPFSRYTGKEASKILVTRIIANGFTHKDFGYNERRAFRSEIESSLNRAIEEWKN